MSYIRCLSNPESLYIFGPNETEIHICYGTESLKSVSSKDFNGLLLLWFKDFIGIDYAEDDQHFSFGSLSLDECNDAGENFGKWVLSNGEWKIYLYTVTLFYIAHIIAQENNINYQFKSR